MEAIILSFKPAVFPALCTGEKRFEYRAQIPQGEVEAYLYLSRPVQKIVGKIELASRVSIANFIKEKRPKGKQLVDLRRLLAEGNQFFSSISYLCLFATPLSLKEAQALSVNFKAPQSYTYLKNYPELQAQLRASDYQKTAINPQADLRQLGLFSEEIIKNYPIKEELKIFQYN